MCWKPKSGTPLQCLPTRGLSEGAQRQSLGPQRPLSCGCPGEQPWAPQAEPSGARPTPSPAVPSKHLAVTEWGLQGGHLHAGTTACAPPCLPWLRERPRSVRGTGWQLLPWTQDASSSGTVFPLPFWLQGDPFSLSAKYAGGKPGIRG